MDERDAVAHPPVATPVTAADHATVESQDPAAVHPAHNVMPEDTIRHPPRPRATVLGEQIMDVSHAHGTLPTLTREGRTKVTIASSTTSLPTTDLHREKKTVVAKTRKSAGWNNPGSR